MDVCSFSHQVNRLIFDTRQPYQEFRARYEDAVPELDSERLAAFAERGAPWPEVIADADASAPHGFLIYWRSDLTPVMGLAGDPARCTAYLMGNHTIAEQMYRHDPSVMLYAPGAPASPRSATTTTPSPPTCARWSSTSTCARPS
jgi:hypothetical protein